MCEEAINIEPVMLTSDELDYELAIRQLQIPGAARERTSRLRKALDTERRMNVSPSDSSVTFSADVRSCREKLEATAYSPSPLKGPLSTD